MVSTTTDQLPAYIMVDTRPQLNGQSHHWPVSCVHYNGGLKIDANNTCVHLKQNKEFVNNTKMQGYNC